MTRSRFLIVMATLLVSTATVSDCRYRGGSEHRGQYERNKFHNPLPVMVIFCTLSTQRFGAGRSLFTPPWRITQDR